MRRYLLFKISISCERLFYKYRKIINEWRGQGFSAEEFRNIVVHFAQRMCSYHEV